MLLVHGRRFNNLRGDLVGGLTAAVVALPVAGVYGAIFVGFFAAVFGGTPA
jgi:SulP family sulfate permease